MEEKRARKEEEDEQRRLFEEREERRIREELDVLNEKERREIEIERSGVVPGQKASAIAMPRPSVETNAS